MTDLAPSLELGVAVTGAAPMWKRVIKNTLEYSASMIPRGGKVVDVGYGDGLLTCYLAKTFGWRITGLDILPEAHRQASRYAREFGVDHLIDFRLVEPDDTWRHKSTYDAVFIKTVLYNAASLNQYAQWLDWVDSVLGPNGIFINFENGKANFLTYMYRKLRRRYYTDLCMYDENVQKLYEERFDVIYRSHHGSISQFLAPLKPAYDFVAAIEDRFFRRTAGNSYITSLVAKKRTKEILSNEGNIQN